jgi:pimeloyl-ACP methyl ester carboxylesterase
MIFNFLKTILFIFPFATFAQTFPSIADKYIDIDNHKIAYKDEGKGQVLLCLHAVGHSSKDFSTLYQLDAYKYRIICLDFPGHGNSDKPTENISATYFSNVVLKFIENLNLKNIIIVGNSIGGATALRVASNNPNIKMISLSNPGGLDKRGFIAPFFLNYMINFFQKGVDNKPNFQKKIDDYYKKVLTTDISISRRNEITRDGYRLAPLLVQAWISFKSSQEDLRLMVKSINCPVLFTWGIKDKFVKFGRNKNAINQFKNYKLIKYEIGHTPYIECPDLFLKDFQEFLKNNDK